MVDTNHEYQISSWSSTKFLVQPDITAPGMNILVAWLPVSLVNMAAGRLRHNLWNINIIS